MKKQTLESHIANLVQSYGKRDDEGMYSLNLREVPSLEQDQLIALYVKDNGLSIVEVGQSEIESAFLNAVESPFKHSAMDFYTAYREQVLDHIILISKQVELLIENTCEDQELYYRESKGFSE